MGSLASGTLPMVTVSKPIPPPASGSILGAAPQAGTVPWLTALPGCRPLPGVLSRPPGRAPGETQQSVGWLPSPRPQPPSLPTPSLALPPGHSPTSPCSWLALGEPKPTSSVVPGHDALSRILLLLSLAYKVSHFPPVGMGGAGAPGGPQGQAPCFISGVWSATKASLIFSTNTPHLLHGPSWPPTLPPAPPPRPPCGKLVAHPGSPVQRDPTSLLGKPQSLT